MSWLGVDVGGPRKGFDVALIDDSSVLALVRHDLDAVVALARSARPRVIGIDSPRSCAPPGETSRADERALARAVCGIRWTPDRLVGPYYEWVVEGLRLYDALAGHEVVEVFPTAWSRGECESFGAIVVPAVNPGRGRNSTLNAQCRLSRGMRG